MSRVFLILPATTAAVVHRVIEEHADRLYDTECNVPDLRAEMLAECALLRTVAGQLKEPA